MTYIIPLLSLFAPLQFYNQISPSLLLLIMMHISHQVFMLSICYTLSPYIKVKRKLTIISSNSNNYNYHSTNSVAIDGIVVNYR